MNTTASPNRSDIYQSITDRIIAAIEAGAGDWRMPWHVQPGDAATAMPVNAATKKAYRGVNVLNLWIAAQAAGYPAGIWATYKQWQELGAQVRKGEKASLVVFWKVFENGEEEDDAGRDDDEDAGSSRGRRFMARGYHVFNCAQVDGFEAPALPQPSEPERIDAAEAFFAAIGADIRHGGSRACYAPGLDLIQMPAFAAFCDPVAYYATLAHESTHWTGHKSRCDRDLKGRFGSEAYAAEELVAELGAAFVCADLGLASEPRPDHAAYIETWLKVLKADKRAIFTAASKAQQAADWMHARQAAAGEEDATRAA
jgi:antirestriction protein ArdC